MHPPSRLKVAKQSQNNLGSRHLTTALKDGTLSLNRLLCEYAPVPPRMHQSFAITVFQIEAQA